MTTIDMDIKKNGLTDFAASLGESGFGAQVSKADTLTFNNRFNAITLNRSLISTLYQEHGVIQVLIDQPVDDAFRGGVTIKCGELSTEDIQKLDSYLEEKGILNDYAQAIKYARLYGGAGIIINAGQDPSMPLQIESIKENTPLEFYAADRWELSYMPQGMSSLDQFAEDTAPKPFNYYGHKLHKDNLIKIKGKEAPSLIRGQFGGWGVSELEKMVRSFNQYLKHQDVSFEILDECKVDVFKIQGFNSAIATQSGAQKTAERVSLAASIKNYQNALVVDSEDDYQQKQLTFAGLAEILTQIRIGLACDLRMPMTKLFGLSASGFNSGEDDIENYNCMIESEIRSKNKQGLIKILKICCQKLFGYVPESLTFDYKTLRIMSEQQESIIKTEQLNRIIAASNGGLITSEKAVEIINNEKIFGITLDENEALSIEEIREVGISTIGEAGKIGRTGRGS